MLGLAGGLGAELKQGKGWAVCGEMPHCSPVCTLSFRLGMPIFSFLYKEIKKKKKREREKKGSRLVLHDAFPVPKHWPCLNARCGDGKDTVLPFQSDWSCYLCAT